jgi:cyclopropane fatty-acyl-phospholipid synthase-like methyltransferase
MMSEPAVHPDRSNGWEAVASRFTAQRSSIGAATVRAWCRALPTGASVLDLGCGTGVPISEALMDEGCVVRGVDASPSLVTEFQGRFPRVPVACEPAEESEFFGETYDGIVAIGLLFLLQSDVQQAVIRRVAAALKPSGRFLFTAPVQTGAWVDVMTGRQSVSLGDEAYRSALSGVGLRVIGEYVDEGENHYYDAAR